MSGLKPNTPEYIPLLGLKCISLVAAGLMGSEVYVSETTDAASKIVGCAVWYGPGRPELTVQNLQYASKYKECFHSALGEGTELNSWSLETIVVDPEYHRRGVGRLLVDAVLKKAVLTNTPFVVECTSKITVHFNSAKTVGFKAMPVPKGGEERRQEFTSVKGENFSLWVLFLSEPGQA
ncbi:hypothetical protein C8J57DRAFT_1510828 [Mycena rebaudengoi]|nr:hypothetical protein C8J57DRAFT_1510828 [Mycena rebaudengoi]